MNQKLAKIYEQIPAAKCPEGCGKCCGILHPSLAEVSNVREWLQTHHREFIPFHMTVGENCPKGAKERAKYHFGFEEE